MTQPLIELEQVSFRWRRGAPVVLEIDHLAVEGGERVFVEGASGSGKSTLLSLIGGVATPQQGRVGVLGEDLATFRGSRRDRFRADHIGFIFQMFNLIPYLSMVENVLLPCRFSRKRRARAEAGEGGIEGEALRLLSHLGLEDERLHHRPVTELSVGQQQRVAAARALIGAPELVIADEPTSSLDADSREAFLRLLMNECATQGTTLLFVSHDASLEPLFDRTVPLAEMNRAATGATAGGAI